MKAVSAMNALADYTANQWGLVTTAQANIASVDNETLARLLEAGLLDRVRRGAYAATASSDDALRQQKAAWLLLNPTVPAWHRPRIDPHGGVLSHRTAALIHSIGDLPADTIEFTVPRRRASKHSDITFRIAQLPENDVTLFEGLPVTTVERTIEDLIVDHIDGGHAVDIIEQALRRGQTEPDTLATRLERHTRRHGAMDSLRTPLDFYRSRANWEATVGQAAGNGVEHAIARATQEAFDPALIPALSEQLKRTASAGSKDFQARLDEILQTSTSVDSLRKNLASMVETVTKDAPNGDGPAEQDRTT